MKITIVSAKSKQTTKLDSDSIFLNPKNGREKSFFVHICTFALKKEKLASKEYLEINFEPLSTDCCSNTTIQTPALMMMTTTTKTIN